MISLKNIEKEKFEERLILVDGEHRPLREVLDTILGDRDEKRRLGEG